MPHEDILAQAPKALIAIGASAGGLDALERFFAAVPAQSGAAFVVIQHLSPDHKSMMAALLARHTAMPVVPVVDEMELQADRVHLIPPGVIMRLEGSRLRLTPKRPRVLALPIDEFFHSAALAWGERVIGIILSGTGTDGTRGAGSINEAGGLLAAQDPASARFDGMPSSVIGTGFVDCVMPANELGVWVGQVLEMDPARRRLGGGEPRFEELPSAEEREPLEDVLRHLTQVSGIDFAEYKPGTVGRRVERRMILRNCVSLAAYLSLIRSDEGEALALQREMLISVTRFFRDIEAFSALAGPLDEAVRLAAENRSPVRIWSAGCSTGEEAYSLAILALEACERQKVWPGVKVFATDLEQSNIDAASIGSYPENIAAEVPQEYLERYFLQRDGRQVVRPELRQCMVFARHNILVDPPLTRIDLVACRNMLIYFRPSAQDRAISRLRYALRPKGFLFLGRSEMGSAIQEDFMPHSSQHKIWQLRADAPRRLLVDRLPPSAEMRANTHREGFLQRAATHVSVAERGQLALLKAYAPPPAILLNHRDELVHSYGDVAPFLALRSGAPSLEALRLLPDAMVPIARAILFRSRRGEVGAVSHPIMLEGRMVRLAVLPVAEAEDLRLLVFEDLPSPDAQDVLSPVDIGVETRERLEMLEGELTATRESLRITIEEMEASSEELQATNEEMRASNEELQSANEELQSVNEELSTVNAEYQEKIDILNRMNADLDNLTRIVPTGTIFIDGALQVTRFSPDATQIFRLRDSDIGRPIGDLAHGLEFPDLIEALGNAMADGNRIEREVSSHDNRQYLVRILPYRLLSSDERSAVLTFVDITQTRTLRMMQAILDGLAETVAVLDSTGRIRMVNAAWTRFAAANGAHDPSKWSAGASYMEACRVMPDAPKDDRSAQDAMIGLTKVLSGALQEFQLEYPCDSPNERRWFLLHARRLSPDFDGAVISHLDISRWKYPARSHEEVMAP